MRRGTDVYSLVTMTLRLQQGIRRMVETRRMAETRRRERMMETMEVSTPENETLLTSLPQGCQKTKEKA